MHKKIEGIVISEYSFEESSKIINIFTENGIVGVVAKGAKKLKSPFFSVTSKLSYGSFNIIYKENGLSRLVDADIFNSLNNIRKDINKINYATYIIELATKVYKNSPSKNIYHLLISALIKINEGFDYIIISDILRLKLLDNLGIKPVIDKCCECGSTNDIVTISSYLGGYVCKSCYKDEKKFSPKTISMIRMLYYVDISKISKLDVSEEVKKEIDEFTNDYYDRYSGIYLTTKAILDSLK